MFRHGLHIRESIRRCGKSIMTYGHVMPQSAEAPQGASSFSLSLSTRGVNKLPLGIVSNRVTRIHSRNELPAAAAEIIAKSELRHASRMRAAACSARWIAPMLGKTGERCELKPRREECNTTLSQQMTYAYGIDTFFEQATSSAC